MELNLCPSKREQHASKKIERILRVEYVGSGKEIWDSMGL